MGMWSMKHVDSVHKKEKYHNCGICDKKFSHSCDLKRHVKKVHEIGKTTQKRKRLSCNKSCSEKGELNNHTMNW